VNHFGSHLLPGNEHHPKRTNNSEKERERERVTLQARNRRIV
jgi:hypothetical protein